MRREIRVMAKLGKIKPVRRMACPKCGKLLPDWSLEEVLGDMPLRCPGCRSRVRLPEEVIQRARRQRYLGGNLDITC